MTDARYVLEEQRLRFWNFSKSLDLSSHPRAVGMTQKQLAPVRTHTACYEKTV